MGVAMMSVSRVAISAWPGTVCRRKSGAVTEGDSTVQERKTHMDAFHRLFTTQYRP